VEVGVENATCTVKESGGNVVLSSPPPSRKALQPLCDSRGKLSEVVVPYDTLTPRLPAGDHPQRVHREVFSQRQRLGQPGVGDGTVVVKVAEIRLRLCEDARTEVAPSAR
jgi:hypothetical protein